jgi:protein ImuB
MCSYMVVCVYLPRFELVVAAGGRAEIAQQALAGRALAIAPLPGAEARVGEVSGAAEAFGVQAGMALGEALARCPELGLVAADPLGVTRAWEAVARALEGIGAALELDRPGLAYFAADGLRGLHGGEQGVIAAARGAVRAAGRAASGDVRAARVGAGPTRFCALAAALDASSRRAVVVDGKGARRYLAAQPVELLRFRAQTAALVEPLRRLGVRTLGELRALSPGRPDAVADRFGEAGVLAHRLAGGADTPLCTRMVEDRLEESLELGEPGSGPALERVLGVLVDRLLARPERRGRTLRAASLSARLVEGGGTWQEQVVFRQALSDARRMRLALSLRLALLPAPADVLRLAVERFGPPDGEQGTLLQSARTARLACLREAVSQVRMVAGPEAALRALCVDEDSRVPERRVVLTPFPG